MPEVTGGASKHSAEPTEVVGSSGDKSAVNGVSENGVSSSSPEKNECEVLLAQGLRHLFVKDYPNAVATLGDACAKLSETYGDLADECAEGYFNYGRALLELAREDSNVLGTDPEKEDSEEGDEEEEDGGKPTENGEAEAKSDDGDKQSEEKDKEADDNKKNEDKEDETADETIDTTKEVNEDGEEADDGKEDDVDNLQLAWEVFELAKQIFERQKSDKKLAETYLYLGEVGLESENYSGAIEDMKRCVEIQKKVLPPDHRDIAETYFQLGVACSLSNEFDEAIASFKSSSDLLETRIKNLEEKGAPEGENKNNPFYSVEKEITEIKALLPEIKAKIVDMEDFKQETIKGVVATIKEKSASSDGAGPSTAPVANGSTPKPATDISHLVRKKRKPEEDDHSDKAVKKPCTTEADK